jgi:hypothetical protein
MIEIEYSQGVCMDGAAILRDGAMMTVDDIVGTLNALQARVAELEAEKWNAQIAEAALLSVEKERDCLKNAFTIAEGLAKQNKEMAENFIAVKLERDGLAAKCTELDEMVVAHDRTLALVSSPSAIAKLKADAVREMMKTAEPAHQADPHSGYAEGFADACDYFQTHAEIYANLLTGESNGAEQN